MNLGYFTIIGIFCNMMLFAIFPYAFTTGTPDILEGDTLAMTFEDSEYFNSKYVEGVNTYTDIQDEIPIKNIQSTETGLVSGSLEGVSSFFDGLLDGLTKAQTLISFIIPFATLFVLLPGALGLVLGTLYMGGFAYAIIRFIRGI